MIGSNLRYLKISAFSLPAQRFVSILCPACVSSVCLSCFYRVSIVCLSCGILCQSLGAQRALARSSLSVSLRLRSVSLLLLSRPRARSLNRLSLSVALTHSPSRAGPFRTVFFVYYNRHQRMIRTGVNTVANTQMCPDTRKNDTQYTTTVPQRQRHRHPSSAPRPTAPPHGITSVQGRRPSIAAIGTITNQVRCSCSLRKPPQAVLQSLAMRRTYEPKESMLSSEGPVGARARESGLSRGSSTVRPCACSSSMCSSSWLLRIRAARLGGRRPRCLAAAQVLKVSGV